MSLKLFTDHPPGLVVCFTTELWERFSYYGMRALLIFFLTDHFLFSDDQSYVIYGTYTALVYLSSVVGGAISDQYLGARKSVTLGAILLVLGHFGMTLEGPAAQRVMVDGAEVVSRNEIFVAIFYLSLSLIVAGVGFLKTNTASLVGALYARDDPRRDAGFTVYYMGVNIGGAAAPLLCGWLGHTYGWRYGFGLAGIGMLFGLAGFLRGQKHFKGLADPPPGARLNERTALGITREWVIYIGALALAVCAWFLLQRQQVVGLLLAATGTAVGAFILYYAFARSTREERGPLLACAVLTLFTIGFWAFYEQMGSSLNVFADRIVDREVLGLTIPASMFQSLPSIFVILLAPLFSMLWLSLARSGREPSAAIKFCLAIVQVGLAFLVLAFGTTLAGADGKVALIWFVLNFLLLVTGELCLSPVGQSMVTRLAPQKIVGFMMGTFFLAYSASSFISGLIARLTSIDAAATPDHAAVLANYISVYVKLGLMAMGVAVILLLLTPMLHRWIRARHEAPSP